ncbi:MAG TPA: hypothetical protein VK464_28160 [Symbiobacteriaceae bacterium]|nr:hypothetical protein [Symbiobacteriaceae bacterium]
MAHTVIGVYRHSGDAEMAAAHLREEYTLEAGELDVIGEAEWENLNPPAPGSDTETWIVASLTGVGLNTPLSGDENPIGKRWGDKVWNGETLVVARTNDPDTATAMAKEFKQTGAYRVDVLPH